MYEAKCNGTAELEREFRETCEMNGDNLAILLAEMKYTYIAKSDVDCIVRYGWSEYDLQMLLETGDADGITRLAAWIRECGEYDHGMVAEDDPCCGYPLDEDGNYVVIPTSEVV